MRLTMLTPVITRSVLPSIDSTTKYPSIPTYHEMGERGRLTDTRINLDIPDDEEIIITEKVDGTNARVIVFPDGNFLIGSRDSLLYAKGDLIINPQLGIVPTLINTPWEIFAEPSAVLVFFLEVYGHNVGKAAKIYAGNSKRTSMRLFDIVSIDIHTFNDLIELSPDKIAPWREHGGQSFLPFDEIEGLMELKVRDEDEGCLLTEDILTVPHLNNVYASELPQTLEETLAFMEREISNTNCPIVNSATGQAEGLVIRTADRRMIAKMRFEDYNRTLKGHK